MIEENGKSAPSESRFQLLVRNEVCQRSTNVLLCSSASATATPRARKLRVIWGDWEGVDRSISISKRYDVVVSKLERRRYDKEEGAVVNTGDVWCRLSLRFDR